MRRARGKYDIIYEAAVPAGRAGTCAGGTDSEE